MEKARKLFNSCGNAFQVDTLQRIGNANSVHLYLSRCTVSIEKAGRHTAIYSAPPSFGVE